MCCLLTKQITREETTKKSAPSVYECSEKKAATERVHNKIVRILINWRQNVFTFPFVQSHTRFYLHVTGEYRECLLFLFVVRSLHLSFSRHYAKHRLIWAPHMHQHTTPLSVQKKRRNGMAFVFKSSERVGVHTLLYRNTTTNRYQNKAQLIELQII